MSSMNLDIFIHSDGRGPRATVKAWWVDGGGIHHAQLMQCHALTMSGEEMNPWSLLSALYVELRDVKAARGIPAADDPNGPETLPERR